MVIIITITITITIDIIIVMIIAVFTRIARKTVLLLLLDCNRIILRNEFFKTSL